MNQNGNGTYQIRPIGAQTLSEEPERPKTWLLTDFLFKECLMMLYAPTGIGKSLFSLGLAYAIATGTRFLKWEAPERSKVLYIDGEMALRDTQNRLNALARIGDAKLDNHYLKFLTMSSFPDNTIPSLVTPEGQAWFLAAVKDKDFIVIDNLGCLAYRVGKMSDEDAWTSISTMLCKLRTEGKTILIVHHSGKSGDYLGSSMRTQPLDYVIKLYKPQEYDYKQTCFDVYFEKIRGGERALLDALYCHYSEVGGQARWFYEPLEQKQSALIKEMALNLKPHEIADCLGVSFYKVKKLLDNKHNDLNGEWNYHGDD